MEEKTHVDNENGMRVQDVQGLVMLIGEASKNKELVLRGYH